MAQLQAPTHPPHGHKVTFEEFLYLGEEWRYAEWEDGEVVPLAAASVLHQDLTQFLTALMMVFVERFGLGRVLSGPATIRLRSVRTGREPDVFFISRHRLHLLSEMYFDGPPDLVVEVISPDSRSKDRVRKFTEYAAAGIPEYWLVNGVAADQDREPEFYRPNDSGTYERVLPDSDGVYHSPALPGFWVRTAWLSAGPPPLLDAMRELDLLRS